LTDTHLRSSNVFRFANYVCNLNDRLTEGDGTAILVRLGIDHHAVPVQGLPHLEATAIQVMLANKAVKFLAVYLSPFRPVIASDLSACLGGGLPVLMAGDLNPKHVEWNSRLITKRGRILRDYADKNSFLIYGPNTPTTVPYNPSAIPRHSYHEGPGLPIASDQVLRTELGSRTYTDRYAISIIFSLPTRPPGFEED
jgi:hypothetical protein